MKPYKLFLITCAFPLLLPSCKNTAPVDKIAFQSNYKFHSEIIENLEKDTVSWKHQLTASVFATNGDYRKALEIWDVAFPVKFTPYSEHEKDSLRAMYKAVPAAAYIVEQAMLSHVVIINEAHHSSLHRVFTKSLLQGLYDIGYKNLGLEALTNGKLKDSLLHDRKYPVMETGHYTKDPQFGNLIRTALEIGYNVFPYETTNRSNGKPREIDQARNIQAVMESRPNEKFLIHCGFSHVLEGDHDQWEKAMAGRLAEFTGIDPLTIEQVAYSENSKQGMSHPLLQAFNPSQSTVLLDRENKPLRVERGNTWADVAVLHPISSYTDERPNWLFEHPNKKVKLDLSKIRLDFPMLVMAFREDDDFREAVPIDLLELADPRTAPVLALPKGAYEIVVVNRKEEAQRLKLVVK